MTARDTRIEGLERRIQRFEDAEAAHEAASVEHNTALKRIIGDVITGQIGPDSLSKARQDFAQGRINADELEDRVEAILAKEQRRGEGRP